jgi:hypothetical protein
MIDTIENEKPKHTSTNQKKKQRFKLNTKLIKIEK